MKSNFYKLLNSYTNFSYSKKGPSSIESNNFASSFFSDLLAMNKNSTLDNLYDSLEKEYEPFTPFIEQFAKEAVKNNNYSRPLLNVVILSKTDNLSITERQNEISLIKDALDKYYASGAFANYKYHAYLLYSSECIRAELFDEARNIYNYLFDQKLKNKFLLGFMNLYVDIFAGKQIDIENEHIITDSLSFSFLNNAIKYIYLIKEKQFEQALNVLDTLEFEDSPLVSLLGYGLTSFKIDLAKTSGIGFVRKFSYLNKSDDEISNLEGQFTLFVREACYYFFENFDLFAQSLAFNSSNLLSLILPTISLNAKLLSVCILKEILESNLAPGKFPELNTLHLFNKIKKAQKKEVVTNDFELCAKNITYSDDQEEFDDDLLELESINFLSKYEPENFIIAPNDNLIIFTTIFLNSLKDYASKHGTDFSTGDFDSIVPITKFDDDPTKIS